MAKPIEADWELIKQLYIQGIAPNKIADRVGVKASVISIRASRGRWKQTQSQVISMLKEESKPILSEAVAEGSIAVRQRLSRHLEQSSALLEQTKAPTSLSALQRQQEAISQYIANCKSIFGWNESSTTKVLDVRSLSAPEPVSTEPAEPTPSSPALLNPGQPGPD